MPTTTKPLPMDLHLLAAQIGGLASRGDFPGIVKRLTRTRPAGDTAYLTAVAFSFLDPAGQQSLREALCAAVSRE